MSKAKRKSPGTRHKSKKAKKRVTIKDLPSKRDEAVGGSSDPSTGMVYAARKGL